MKKYELTDSYINFYGRKLYRIRALETFGDVKKGDIGGYVESGKNLSQEGECWIYDNAAAFDNARVFDNAKMRDNSKIFNNAEIFDHVQMFNNARIFNNAKAYDNSKIYDNARLHENARIFNNAKIHQNAIILGAARVCDNSEIFGNAVLKDNVNVYDNARIYKNVTLRGNAYIGEDADIFKDTHYLNIGAIGSQKHFVTFFRDNNKKIIVQYGYFMGDLEKFEKKVLNKHKGTKHEKIYKLAIELARKQIECD